MKVYSTIFLIFFLGCFTFLDKTHTSVASKRKKSPPIAIPEKYPDIIGQLKGRIMVMQKKQYNLSKIIVLNDKKDSTFINNPNWETQLKFVDDLDLNAKKYQDQFIVTHQNLENNDAMLSFVQKKKENIIFPLSTLEVEQQVNKDIIHIKAQLRFENFIYSKKEYIDMQFNHQGLLTHYEISGGSKMITQDTLIYNIKGVVITQN